MNEKKIIDRLKKKYSNVDTTNFNLFDFIHSVGSGLEALMYSKLFWPDFVEIDGMIFLKDWTIEDEDDINRIRKTFEDLGRDPQETEKFVNLIEIPYMFGQRIGEIEDDEYYWLAEIICVMWRCRLGLLYPNRKFVVEITDPENGNNGGLAVVFYQE